MENHWEANKKICRSVLQIAIKSSPLTGASLLHTEGITLFLYFIENNISYIVLVELQKEIRCFLMPSPGREGHKLQSSDVSLNNWGGEKKVVKIRCDHVMSHVMTAWFNDNFPDHKLRTYVALHMHLNCNS